MADSKRVLVIDDDDTVRDTLSIVLSDAGFEVVAAGDGEEALEILSAQRFDLVIADIFMPQKEGIETIIEIRKLHPDVRIVAMSGGGQAGDLYPLSISTKLGADARLLKPFAPEVLLAVVAGVFAETGSQLSAERPTSP